MVRNIMASNKFKEVFIETPLLISEEQDLKGHYFKVRKGKLKNLTGIDSSYEVSEIPEIHIIITKASINKSADQIIEYITIFQ